MKKDALDMKHLQKLGNGRTKNGSWGLFGSDEVRSRKSMGRQPKTKQGQNYRGDVAYGRSSRGETVSVRKARLKELRKSI